MDTLYRKFQHCIQTAQHAGMVGAIQPHPKLSPQQQLAIYSDGYRIRLSHAIGEDYPALKAYMGSAAFDALVAAYVDTCPSYSYNLDRYPQSFADDVAGQLPDGFALELAKLEQAIGRVFMAPESMALDAAAFAAISPEVFGETVLPLRTALQLMTGSFPANAWLDAHRSGTLPASTEPAPEYLCILRHQHTVRRLVLEAPAYRVLTAIGQGLAVGMALEQAIRDHPQDEQVIASHLQQWFAGWVAAGVFAALPRD